MFRHSQDEPRRQAMGRTIGGRLLHVTFTLRPDQTRIRVISARVTSRRERGYLNKKLKPSPRFRNEAEERRFWESHDSTDYVDWSRAKHVSLPNLKMSTTAISLRLPQGLLDRIKVAANKRDVPYQSLIKVWLAEKVDAQ
jgi:predicted DNA binding CopG/RHH family protein